MQDKINNKEQDLFSELIRQKLENHQLPVDAECWNEIEERLKSKKRRTIPLWFLITGGAAVATLALLFSLHIASNSTDFIGKSKSANFKIENPRLKHIAKQQIIQTLETVKTKNFQLSIEKQSLRKKDNTINENMLAQIQKVSPDTTENNQIINSNTGKVNNQMGLNQATAESEDSINDKKIAKIIPNSLTEMTIKESIAKSKDKTNWLLTAAVETGGGMNLSSSNSNLMANNGYAGLTSASGSYLNDKIANDYSQKTYLPPFSVGFTIRKSIDKTIGIETGLVYTYLVSTFANNGVQQKDANLKLHYLGVPLNLVVKLWSNPKWEIYLSGGTMVEKGLVSIYTQNEYINNQTSTTMIKTGIDGFQWSANAAAGAAYKIQKNWGIYFEPKFSYFFDNNQPVSARTQYPVVFGLSLGLRYQFK
ncbi:MAG: hypothetical protein P4L34_13505 [Paludibacter sp.]|nr:hypothetical protein [Paludibacter sp.]